MRMYKEAGWKGGGWEVADKMLFRHSRRRAPKPDRLVFRCRRDQLAVRRECHGVDRTRMALEHAVRCSRR